MVIKKILFLLIFMLVLVGFVSAWSVSISNPLQDSLHSSKVTEIDWSYSGINKSDIANVSYDINGLLSNFPSYTSPDTDSTISINSQEGNNTCTIYVATNIGEIRNFSVDFWVDSMAPVLDYRFPSSNKICMNDDSFNFQFWLNETNKGDYDLGPLFGPFSLRLIDPYNNPNSPFPLHNLSSGDITLSNILPLTMSVYEGDYTWIVKSRDVDPSGNDIRAVNLTGTITRDITNPEVLIISPLDIGYVKGTISIGVLDSDNLCGPNDIVISVSSIGDLASNVWNTTGVDDGVYNITATATDKAGNSASDSVSVTVDNTAPNLTLLGSNPETVEINTTYTDAGAIALDLVDGNLTSSIVLTGSVDTFVVGSYILTYTVSDIVGNIAVETRTVNVVDTTAPIINLLGIDPVIIEAGNSYIDAGVSVSDNSGEVINASVTGSVYTNTLGTYTIYYDAVDSSGNNATQVTRTVNVVDTTAPNITLNGSGNITVELGSIYVDAGVTVSDNSGENLSSSIVVVNPVNTNVLGNYTVTYDVNDSSGNNATQVTRTVNVVDTTAPNITLIIGNNFAKEFNDNDVTITFNVSDDGGIDYCDVYLDSNFSGNVSLGGVNWSFPFFNLSVGKHSWYLNCFDNNGNNASSETQYFTILSNLTEQGDFEEYTNLTQEDDITNVTNFFVSNLFGSINWTEGIYFSSGFDWSKFVNLSENRIEVNSSGAPELNKSAIITFFNLSYENAENIELVKDGEVICKGSSCDGFNYTNGTLTIEVSGFSVYSTSLYVASTSSSGGGGGGGSSSGGSCITSWDCNDWSECIDGEMTRICSKQDEDCVTNQVKPIETMICSVASEEDEEELIVGDEEIDLGDRAGITGGAIGTTGKVAMGAGIFIILIVGIYLFIKYKKRKQEDKKIAEETAVFSKKKNNKNGKKEHPINPPALRDKDSVL